MMDDVEPIARPYRPLRGGGHLAVSGLPELSRHVLYSLHHLLLETVLGVLHGFGINLG